MDVCQYTVTWFQNFRTTPVPIKSKQYSFLGDLIQVGRLI